jgi:hypothetical protein
MRALSVLLCLAAVFSLPLPVSADIIADLQQDFSLTSNPNTGSYGTWSFNMGSTPLSAVSSINGGIAYPGWGTPANAPGDFLPAFFQVTYLQPNFDAAIGNIGVHSTDPFNGAGNGPANVTWTSPLTGPVTISGELWSPGVPQQAGRSNDYLLLLNPGPSQTVLASGTILESGSNNSANPITFSLPSESLFAGEILQLYIAQDPQSGAGSETMLDLTISTPASASEPASLTLMGSGFLAFGGYRLLRRRRCPRSNQLE